MGQCWFDGYSADIEIFLRIDGKRFDVAQIGSGSLILREPAPIPPNTHASLVIRIDGREEVETVFLGKGALLNQQPVSYSLEPFAVKGYTSGSAWQSGTIQGEHGS